LHHLPLLLRRPGKEDAVDNPEVREPSPENQKKYEYATDHFERLNKWLAERGETVRYQFNFLSPGDFLASLLNWNRMN
jgi:uncharacterized protein CbrC (UPF0167 family)